MRQLFDSEDGFSAFEHLPPSVSPLADAKREAKVRRLVDLKYGLFDLRNSEQRAELEAVMNSVLKENTAVLREDWITIQKTGELLVALKYARISEEEKKGEK